MESIGAGQDIGTLSTLVILSSPSIDQEVMVANLQPVSIAGGAEPQGHIDLRSLARL